MEAELETIQHEGKWRTKENCEFFYRKTYPEWGGYYGQGDYRVFPKCKVDAMEHLDIYTPEDAVFVCPLYCPSYKQRGE